MRTLIVEDDFTSRLLLQTFLSRYGECHIAINGKEAVEAFQKATENGSPYDLICMDILMPVMRGTDAVKEVRALEKERGIFPPSGVKIVMTSVLDDAKEVMRSFKEVCDGYLIKPIDIADLVGLLRYFHLVE
jgi:two-component system chemotaxis response regulator CheY